MKKEEILSHVDHTLLTAFATWEDIQLICKEAIEYKTAAICIPPCYVKRVYHEFGDTINICTVVGFPLGYSTTKSKLTEVHEALANGANEIDMVINISDIKNALFDKVEDEIKEIKKAVGNKILKVIIETCYLNEEEKIKMCEIVTKTAADFIKTSTGFGTLGATLADIRLFKKHIGPHVKIKAAGGVKSIEDLEMFIQEGCERIGTSSAINMVKGYTVKGY